LNIFGVILNTAQTEVSELYDNEYGTSSLNLYYVERILVGESDDH